MKSQSQILSTLRKYKREHAKEYGIEEIGIFGSFARGEATDESDIDIFLKLKRSNLFLLSRIRIELEALLGMPTDVVQLRDRMNRYLKKHIEDEAISA
jgi:predicted nucleotidyltransferase